MRRLVLGSLTAALLLTLTGCGGGNTSTETAPASSPPVAEQSESESAAGDPSATPTEDVEPTASATPTEPPPAPTVAPATGAELTSEIISVRAPADFGQALPASDGGSVRQIEELRKFMELYARKTSGAATPDQLISFQGENGITGQPMKRLPDVLVDGQPAYHQAGPDPSFDGWREEFGLRYGGYDITISLNTRLDTPQAERDAMNAAVLASARLLK